VVLKFEHDPGERGFGEEAVEALTSGGDVDPEQVYKTRVIAVPAGLAVAVLPVPFKLSLKAAAAALGAPKATMAEQAVAQKATGSIVGAISPLGQRKRLPTVVHSEALAWDRIYCSAGRRGWDIGLDPRDLIRLTAAVAAPIRA
jgi:Cys-tRNA(Pro)/Cys-tRNA(Cys) deacylase